MTKLSCAQLAFPPHAKFNHTNPSELQAQFIESPGLNHSDLWRVTSYRSNLWIFTDSPFRGSPRISSSYTAFCPALWILRWLSFRVCRCAVPPPFPCSVFHVLILSSHPPSHITPLLPITFLPPAILFPSTIISSSLTRPLKLRR